MRRLTLLLVSLAFAAGECHQVPEQKFGSIVAMAFDGLGHPTPSVELQLINPTTQEVQESSRRGRIDSVLYGRHEIRILAPGFRSETLLIDLAQPELAVRAQLAISLECPSKASTLSGSISPPPQGRELWVKAVPLRGVGGSETLITPRGFYSISGLKPGEHMIAVLHGKSVIYTKVIEVSQDTNLSIKLTP